MVWASSSLHLRGFVQWVLSRMWKKLGWPKPFPDSAVSHDFSSVLFVTRLWSCVTHEGFSAFLTMTGFLSKMSYSVCLWGAGVSVGFTALFTFRQFLCGESSLTLLKITGTPKCFTTFLYLHPFSPLWFICLKTVIISEAFPTFLIFIKCLFSMNYFVCF